MFKEFDSFKEKSFSLSGEFKKFLKKHESTFEARMLKKNKIGHERKNMKKKI